MARVRIGVDIGATAVRAAEVKMGPPTLVRVGQVPLPPEAVTNGEVRDPDAVSAALKELWHVGKFRKREVVLGVGNQRVVVREVSLPWLPEKELRSSLPFQVQEHVPIAVEEAVLDYEVLSEFEQEGRRMVRLLLVAAQKSMVDEMVQAAEAAKLHPVGLDLIPFSIVRSVGSVDGLGLNGQEMGDEAVIDIGADLTSISVHAGGVPRFVRILSSGGREVTAAIARSMGISEDEAERLKRGESHDPDKIQQAAQIAQSRATSFVDEIRSSLDFYVSQAAAGKIGRVLITGGGSKLPGLFNLLDERLATEVARGRAFHRVNPALDLSPDAMEAAEPLLAVAVGLALPGGRE
ncbi:MAG TPA: type IV pilus assembly protein PilM [Actinomycetota bacterium]|jgi:type IV pilus assembly protein PilM